MNIDSRAEHLEDFIVLGVCSGFVREYAHKTGNTDRPKKCREFGHAGNLVECAKNFDRISGQLKRFYNQLDPNDRDLAALREQAYHTFVTQYIDRPYDLADVERLIDKALSIASAAAEPVNIGLPTSQAMRPRRYYGRGRDRIDAFTFCG